MANINVKPKAAWSARASFILGISMGSQNHVGEALEAIIDKINNGFFTDGIIDLSDTLNRYRYIAEGKSQSKALAIARNEGDEWLAKSNHILSRLSVPAIVRRWDEWLSHPDYSATRERYQKIFKANLLLQSAINQDIENFYVRNYGISKISESMHSLSVEYYLEELAVQTLILKEKPSTVIYPGKQLECFKLIRSGQISDAPTPLANSPYARLVVHSFVQPPAVNQNRGVVAVPALSLCSPWHMT